MSTALFIPLARQLDVPRQDVFTKQMHCSIMRSLRPDTNARKRMAHFPHEIDQWIAADQPPRSRLYCL
jgi:hypothetical protein